MIKITLVICLFSFHFKVLEIDETNVKALYRRGQANTNMKDFEQAKVFWNAGLATALMQNSTVTYSIYLPMS